MAGKRQRSPDQLADRRPQRARPLTVLTETVATPPGPPADIDDEEPNATVARASASGVLPGTRSAVQPPSILFLSKAERACTQHSMWFQPHLASRRAHRTKVPDQKGLPGGRPFERWWCGAVSGG